MNGVAIQCAAVADSVFDILPSLRLRILNPSALISFVFVAHSAGCVCAFKSAKGAWKETPLVFIGRLQRIETTRHPGKQWSFKDGPVQPYTTQKAWIRVDENFKGTNVGEVFVTADTDGDCAIQFAENAVEQQWLFYAWPNPGSQTVHLGCTRSSRLEYAGDDLLFLRSLPKSDRMNRLSGSVFLIQRPGAQTPDDRYAISGARLTIYGDSKTYEVETDRSGVFELTDLPAGSYRVYLRVPESDSLYMSYIIGESARESSSSEFGEQPKAVSLGTTTAAEIDFILIPTSTAERRKSHKK